MMKWILALCLSVGAFVVLVGSAAGEEGILARVVKMPDGVMWELLGPFQGMTLTVARPDGEVVQSTFPAGSSPYFDLSDPAGYFPDGQYTWELRIMAPSRRGGRGYYAKSGEPDTVRRQESVESGHFVVSDGAVVYSDEIEEDGKTLPKSGSGASAARAIVPRDVLHLDDVIVTGSLCVGFDCVNGESFGFDTIVLKENNLRIYFRDTSSTAAFPTNDWRITVNDSTSGGGSYFAVQDVDDSTTPFKIEAGAPSNSLYVEDYGRVGLGTSTPVVELHIKDSDTPTVRLEQDSSGGWTAQTWDVAGNESNFFVRDATNGSKLPFRIQPNTPSSTLCLKSSGDVGIGTWSPDEALHLERSDNTAMIKVEDTGSTGASAQTLLLLENNGAIRFDLVDNSQNVNWGVQNVNGRFAVSKEGTGVREMALDGSGNLSVTGDFISGGTTLNVPDYVFAPDYPLMPIGELSEFITRNRHLPNLPSVEDIKKEGQINHSQMQMRLLEKIEELTLYTLAQARTIRALEDRLAAIEKEVQRAD